MSQPHTSVSRRHFFFGALACTGCARVSKKTREHLVTVAKASTYDSDLENVFRGIIRDHRLDIRNKRVVLKPNLVEFDSARPINTDPRVVAAAWNAFQAEGAREVLLAEGPGHRRTTWEMAEAAGYFQAVPRFESIFTDLNVDEVRRVRLRRPFSSLRELYLPVTALGADLLVSIAKMKTHHWAGATLAMKNLFGVVPGAVYGWPKNILHWSGIDESVADLHSLFPRQFCIVDGIVAMEGNGPVLGSAKRMGVVVAGSHPPSVDEICCRMMRIDPEKIGYLRLARSREGEASRIKIAGENLDQLASSFKLLPELEYLRLS